MSAVDELAMATERLRVRHPKEPKPNPPVHHIIEPHEVQCKEITGKGTAHQCPKKCKAHRRDRVRAVFSSVKYVLHVC